MGRARAWGALAVLALALVPAAAGAVAVPGVPAALPVPLAAQPRLGFVDHADQLTRVEVEARAGQPLWGASATSDFEDFATDHRHDGEASVLHSRLYLTTTWVGTADSDSGDIYYSRQARAGGAPVERRLTCNTAHESHPVLSPDGTRVAFATDARGDWDIATVPSLPTGDPCAPDYPVTYLTGPQTLDTWPTWLDDDRLVYAGAVGPARPDLYAVTSTGTPIAQLTATPTVSETQPGSMVISGGWRLVLTTTQFRPDGSLALLVVSDAPNLPSQLFDPYRSSCCRPQGSEGTWSDEGAIAFTSTTSDPAGDVWITRWVAVEGGFSPQGEGPVVDTPGVSESHPAWLAHSLGGGDVTGPSATLLFTDEVPSAEVGDAVADDGSGLRPIQRLGPTYDGSIVADAGIDYSPDGTRVVYSEPSTPDPPDIDDDGPPILAAAAVLPAYGQHLVIADATSLVPAGPAYTPENDDDIDLDPTWSPDGRTIAFVRREAVGEGNDPPSIYTLDVASRTVTEVTTFEDEPDGWAVDPSWSPDSRRLVYTAGTETFGARLSDEANLTVVDVATKVSTPVVISVDDCDDGEACIVPVQGRSPDWSPDGTQIAAADLTVLPPALADELGVPADDPRALELTGGIGVVHLDSRVGPPVVDSARALTGVPSGGAETPSVAQVVQATDPAWSPDGTRIAFSSSTVGRPGERRGLAEVSATDGSGLRVVVDPPGQQRKPAYQPWTDVVLTLVSSPVARDGTATLTATVQNAGVAPAATPTVTVQLPAGITAALPPGCSATANQLTCPLSGPLASGAQAVIALSVDGVTTTAGSTVTGVVVTASPERVVSNNTATVGVGRPGGVGVDVTLSTPPVAWVGGVPITATITVRNAGETLARDVALTTSYPPTLTPSGVAPCAVPAGTCALGDLAGGDAAVFTATLTPDVVFEGLPQTGDVTATVTTTSPDPHPGDDTDRATVTVRRPHVAVQPAVARPGEVVFLVGTDFPPGADVALSWSTGLMGAVEPVTAAPDGGWTRATLLLRDTLVFNRMLLARSTPVVPLYSDVTAPLLVVPTSIDAPTFLFRK